MKTTAARFYLALVFCMCSSVHAVTFDWATIGTPGNDDDTHGDGYGSVSYTFRISKHEVTNAQYTEFLNAVAATDTYGLYTHDIDFENRGGITRHGSPGRYTYSVRADEVDFNLIIYKYGDKPVVYISFFEAMRFVNWLEKGQPTGPQGAATTEDGVYAISDGVSEVRNPDARYFIPSEDEWYKAAYYDPVDNVYYDYPTSTDIVPDNSFPIGTGNSANYSCCGTTTGDRLHPFTDVGAFTLSDSPYGTFDQGGNAWEWNEAVISSSGSSSSFERGLRGGGTNQVSSNLRADHRNSFASGFFASGFRVASIPEPNGLLMGLLGCIGSLLSRCRSCGVTN